MKYCKNCGTGFADSDVFCPKCGAQQTAPTQAAPPEPILRFFSWKMAPTSEIVEIIISLLLAVWIWSMQSDLSSWFYAEEKTMLKLLSIMILLCSIPSSIFSILQKKQIYLQLEPNEVRGVWVRSQLFIVRVEPFRLSYGKIEETRVQGSGTGSLSLKVRGRWKSVPVERGREVKELIDQRRRSLH